MKGFIFLFVLLLNSTQAFAKPVLSNIDQSDLDKISEEFAANFTHTTVSPAKSLGWIWGVEVGFILGATTTPDLNAFVQEADPNQKVDGVPHGAFTTSISVPYGITAEINFFPKTTKNDVSLKVNSYALKWTFTDLIFDKISLFDAAIKIHRSDSKLSFAQTINNESTGNTDVVSDISFETVVSGANASISGDWLIFEPFIGLGFLNYETDAIITALGNATIFDSNFQLVDQQRAMSSGSSSHIFAGIQFDLLFVHLAFEWASAFGSQSYTGKFAFHF